MSGVTQRASIEALFFFTNFTYSLMTEKAYLNGGIKMSKKAIVGLTASLIGVIGGIAGAIKYAIR